MTILIKDKGMFACDEVKIATEIVPDFIMTMLKCEWFDKLIAECEAKANKKLDVHETMFVVDYAVSLLEGDAENEYVDQTVDESGITDGLIPEGHPIAMFSKCVDVEFSFSENTTEFMDKCEEYFGKKMNLHEKLLVLRYAVGFKSHEVDVDDLLSSMNEADL